jgi:preprotein translocase subunit SecG
MVVGIIALVHILMCIILIAIVLLQTGKGASMGAAFGGASQTLFGSSGPANFLNKITTIAAVVFMLTSFTLTILSSRSGGTSSKVLNATPKTQQEQPKQAATPGTATQSNAPATEQPKQGATSETATQSNAPATEQPAAQPSAENNATPAPK